MKSLIARILCSAAHSMWHKDPTLGHYTSETNQHELNLAFHYACELRQWFPWLDCDFDVSKKAYDYERPDIVIHRRNTHALNFLVIEIKREKSRKEVPLDLKQIRERWFENYFQYRFGAAVILHDDKPQFEVQVLSRVEKEHEPLIRKYLNMGKPLCRPIPEDRSSTALVETLKRIFDDEARGAVGDASVWDREIDQLVYALYGLTPEEIKMVEGASNRHRGTAESRAK
jgi:hypothetical protein